MAIATLQQTLIRTLLVIGFTSLAACGGGDSSKPKDDTTPNAFTFTDIENAEVSTLVDSDSVTITGINKATPITITGGEYAIGDTAFTAAAGTVTNNQAVKVRLTSSANTNTPVSATLTIGGVVGTFTVTTEPDVTPEPFSFEPDSVVEVEPNSEHTSSTITVNDIDIPIAISITNGEYKIGDGAYTSTAGTVSNGQVVTVRVIAPSTTELTKEAVLTIGGVSASFSVTTYVDTAAPVAEFKFPSPYSMTDASTVKVRGIATDYNTITSVKVKVNDAEPFDVTPKAEGDYSSWTADIPLVSNSENTIVVLTDDVKGNTESNAAQVVIRQGDIDQAFPNTNNQFPSSFYGSVLDKSNGSNRLLVADRQKHLILSIDMLSGERSVFAAVMDAPYGLFINPVTDLLYVTGDQNPTVIKSINLNSAEEVKSYEIDFFNVISSIAFNNKANKIVSTNFSTGEMLEIDVNLDSFKVFSDASQGIPNAENPMGVSYGVAFDGANDRYLVTDTEAKAIFSVDSVTGEREVFSSNTVGEGPLFGEPGWVELLGVPSAIAIDETNNRAIVTELYNGDIFGIDLTTGNRSIISAVPAATSENTDFAGDSKLGAKFGDGLVIVSPDSYALVNNGDIQTFVGVIAVDLVTGERVVFSKNACVGCVVSEW